MAKQAMAKSVKLMQTFDQALFQLCEKGRITQEDALRTTGSINELRLKLHSKNSSAKDAGLHIGLSLHEEAPREETQEQPD